MKYINISRCWRIVYDPYPALKGVIQYDYSKRVLYTIPIIGNVPITKGSFAYDLGKDCYVAVDLPEYPADCLSDHEFVVARDRENSYYIVEGTDISDRCLLVCGVSNKGYPIDIRQNDGILIGDCYARSSNFSRREVAVVIPSGGVIEFLSEWSVTRYEWNGSDAVHYDCYRVEEDAD